jgi:hypothetical protein
VKAAISHEDNHDWILPTASPGGISPVTPGSCPAGRCCPGQTLTDALHPAAAIRLTIEDVTRYLGHYDHAGARITRLSCFAVTVTDPGAICRHAGTGHRWAVIEDLDYPPTQGACPAAR